MNGELLKLMIKDSGKSITQIAKMSNVSRQTIYTMIESPNNCNIKTLEAVCNVLGVSVDDMIDLTPNKADFFEFVVENDDMSPFILKNDIATVKLQNHVNDKDIILVEGEFSQFKRVIKRVKLDGNGGIMIFNDSNPLASMQFFMLEDFIKRVQIVGRVVEVRRNFE